MQAIGIFAAEVIVPLAIDLAQRIWINIRAANSKKRNIVGIRRGRTTGIGRYGIKGNMSRNLVYVGIRIIAVEKILEHREHICENVVIFDGVILEIAAARTE